MDEFPTKVHGGRSRSREPSGGESGAQAALALGRTRLCRLPRLCYNNGRLYVGVLEEGDKMKTEIHPRYQRTTITCSCGAVYQVGSTRENLRIEVCGKCHPVYTGGQQRLVDTGGRVERFKRKYGMK